MSNWDSLIVECENEGIIERLAKEQPGIEGLWFREAFIDPENPKKCALSVRNGVDWIEAFKELSKESVLRCKVTFEHDRYLLCYCMVFEGGEYVLEDVKVGYMWEIDHTFKPLLDSDKKAIFTANGNQVFERVPECELTREQVEVVESWCRGVDDIERQKRKFIETNGESDIDYNDTKVMNRFKFNGLEITVIKEGPMVVVQEVEHQISEDEDDVPF